LGIIARIEETEIKRIGPIGIFFNRLGDDDPTNRLGVFFLEFDAEGFLVGSTDKPFRQCLNAKPAIKSIRKRLTCLARLKFLKRET